MSFHSWESSKLIAINISKSDVCITNFKSTTVFNIALYSVWKVFVFGVFLVRIFPHSDWVRKDTPYLCVSAYLGQMRENATTKILNICTFYIVMTFVHVSGFWFYQACLLIYSIKPACWFISCFKFWLHLVWKT